FGKRCRSAESRKVGRVSPTLGTGQWQTSEETSFCSPTTMYDSGPAGLLPIRMQSVVSLTPTTLGDGFCRIGGGRSLGGLGVSLCRGSMGHSSGAVMA